MPLSLGQIKVKTIVDWNIEWRKEWNSVKEYPKNPIRRGMIVRIEGDSSQESVDGIWATFGPDVGKDQFESNGVTVPCIKVKASELNMVYDAGSRVADEAWKRTFKVPDQVGTIYEARANRSGKPKTIDSLQLTAATVDGPIVDGPSPLVVKDED